MLASPVETVEEALQRFSTEVAEEAKSGEVHPEGPVIKEAQLEDKYDGIGHRFTVARPNILAGGPFPAFPGGYDCQFPGARRSLCRL